MKISKQETEQVIYSTNQDDEHSPFSPLVDLMGMEENSKFPEVIMIDHDVYCNINQLTEMGLTNESIMIAYRPDQYRESTNVIFMQSRSRKILAVGVINSRSKKHIVHVINDIYNRFKGIHRLSCAGPIGFRYYEDIRKITNDTMFVSPTVIDRNPEDQTNEWIFNNWDYEMRKYDKSNEIFKDELTGSILDAKWCLTYIIGIDGCEKMYDKLNNSRKKDKPQEETVNIMDVGIKYATVGKEITKDESVVKEEKEVIKEMKERNINSVNTAVVDTFVEILSETTPPSWSILMLALRSVYVQYEDVYEAETETKRLLLHIRENIDNYNEPALEFYKPILKTPRILFPVIEYMDGIAQAEYNLFNVGEYYKSGRLKPSTEKAIRFKTSSAYKSNVHTIQDFEFNIHDILNKKIDIVSDITTNVMKNNKDGLKSTIKLIDSIGIQMVGPETFVFASGIDDIGEYTESLYQSIVGMYSEIPNSSHEDYMKQVRMNSILYNMLRYHK